MSEGLKCDGCGKQMNWEAVKCSWNDPIFYQNDFKLKFCVICLDKIKNGKANECKYLKDA